MKTLLLSLLLLAAPVAAESADIQLYTARADGSLTIGPDGRVVDVELESEGNLGAEVIEGFEERIRAWRFEPISEDGRPVIAKGRLSLALVAAREEGSKSNKFGIRHVQFLDPPGAPSPVGAARMSPPSYPKGALRDGAGAEVGLLLRIDAQGKVVSVATERLELLGVSATQGHLGHLEAQFRRSAERVAMSWTFEGFPEGEAIRVPVRYVPSRYTAGWIPTVFRPVQMPEWAVLEKVRADATELSAGGLAVATRFKLLTPLDEA